MFSLTWESLEKSSSTLFPGILDSQLPNFQETEGMSFAVLEGNWAWESQNLQLSDWKLYWTQHLKMLQRQSVLILWIYFKETKNGSLNLFSIATQQKDASKTMSNMFHVYGELGLFPYSFLCKISFRLLLKGSIETTSRWNTAQSINNMWLKLPYTYISDLLCPEVKPPLLMSLTEYPKLHLMIWFCCKRQIINNFFWHEINLILGIILN